MYILHIYAYPRFIPSQNSHKHLLSQCTEKTSFSVFSALNLKQAIDSWRHDTALVNSVVCTSV